MVPPPEYDQSASGDPGPYDDLELPFVREDTVDGGVQCGRSFSSAAGLAAHRRHQHGYTNVVRRLVLSNQCPVCMSTLSSGLGAQQHL
eukprot:11084168-Alexandrium_andersonii.AAC.1